MDSSMSSNRRKKPSGLHSATSSRNTERPNEPEGVTPVDDPEVPALVSDPAIPWDKDDITLNHFNRGATPIHRLCGRPGDYFARITAGGYWFGVWCPFCRRDLVQEEAHFDYSVQH